MKKQRTMIILLLVLVFLITAATGTATAADGKAVLAAPKVSISNRESDGKPRLTWNQVKGASKYEIYRATSKNGTYEKWYTTTATAFVNLSAKTGRTYYFKVKALSVNGSSPYSNMVYRVCDLPQPVVTAGNRPSDGKPKLTWDSIEGAKTYEIYRSGYRNGTYHKMYTTSSTQYINTSANAGYMYFYKVKAISEETIYANSAYSTVDYRTCDLPRPKVTASNRLSDAKPYLDWEPVNGASKYEIYRAVGKDQGHKKWYTTTRTDFVHTSAEPGTTYYFRVRALSSKTAAADSAQSESKSCTCWQPYIVSSTDSKYTHSDFKEDMNQLVDKYPDRLKKQYLGLTVDGRGLYALILGNPKAEKQIFVTAGFHAREYINCQLTMRFLEYYCRNYNSGTYKGISYKDLFQKVSICILPMVNPDGIAISTYGPEYISDSSLRAKIKKMPRNGSYSNWKSNARGVDLNRNYKMYSTWPEETTYSSEGYPGPSRYSEKETQAVLKAMDNCSNIQAVINYHSMGNVIYWGYHSQSYKSQCWAFAKVFRDMTGYGTIDESNTKATYGDYEHYIMHEYRIPYVCIETGRSDVPVPNSQFNGIYYKNKMGFAAAAYHFR